MFGPGVERSGLKANEPTHFTVDCTEAGEGEIRLRPPPSLSLLDITSLQHLEGSEL